jgi:molecular chaperone GrpE
MKKEKNNIKKGKGRDKMAESEEVLKEDIPVNDNADAADAKDDVAVLADKVAELEGIIATMKEDELRRAADTENYKRRLRLEKENAVKYANEQLISDLLDPIDNFARAIEAADLTKDFDSMRAGIVMVQDQMLSILKNRWGLEMIEALNKDFDPNEMEAYAVIEDDKLDGEKVVQEYMKGWKLNGKVLRSAKVVVGKPKSN